jgi:regulator of protease activity HflC (stomatin/prohibitin superfamily)
MLCACLPSFVSAQSEVNAQAAFLQASKLAESQAAQIRAVAEAEAHAHAVRSEAAAAAVERMAKVIGSNPALMEMEKARMLEELSIKKIEAIVQAGAKVVPVEMLRLFDLADERLVSFFQTV